MAEIEHPQIYLISPPEVELSRFPKLLGECLDAVPVACFRLALSTQDEDKLSKIADACREVCHVKLQGWQARIPPCQTSAETLALARGDNPAKVRGCHSHQASPRTSCDSAQTGGTRE